MKSYSHILSKMFYEPMVVTPMRHAAIWQLIQSKIGAGGVEVNVGSIPKADPEDGDGPEQNYYDPDQEDEESEISGTCIIPVHGTLVMHSEDLANSECGCALYDLQSLIDSAERDPRISRVIYDFRSPGGSVTGVEETGRKILNSRKETIAYTDSECCSGAIWLASQCEKFYATPSSRVGSVGVYCMTLDMSKAMEEDGMKVNAVFAAKYKLLGASFKPLEDDEREILQKGVSKIYKQFKTAMESHRVVDDENFGSGLVFDGEDAASIGFTDGCVDSLDEVLDNLPS